MAKNKFVNTQLKGKGIPSLEFQAIILGAECLIGIYKDLTGPNSIIPINIVELQLYTDSMVSLNWIDTHVNKLGKTQQKRSVFITNRLNHLNKICESFPIKFNFVSGIQNPADHVTRPLSYKKLNKTNYFTGPEFLPTKQLDIKEDLVSVIIPNPLISPSQIIEKQQCVSLVVNSTGTKEELIPIDKYSSFRKLLKVYMNVFVFIHNIKLKLKARNPDKYPNLDSEKVNFYAKARELVFRNDQMKTADCYKYLYSKKRGVMPNIIGQLNVFPDKKDILRVKSKCSRGV